MNIIRTVTEKILKKNAVNILWYVAYHANEEMKVNKPSIASKLVRDAHAHRLGNSMQTKALHDVIKVSTYKALKMEIM